MSLPGHCFTVIARPFDVDGDRYYDGTWYAPKEEDTELLSCERYTPEGEEPGHIIAKVKIDAAGLLYLRFPRNKTLLRFQDPGQLDARVIETAGNKLVDEYLLVEIASDDVVALLRALSEGGCFRNRWDHSLGGDSSLRRFATAPTCPATSGERKPIPRHFGAIRFAIAACTGGAFQFIGKWAPTLWVGVLIETRCRDAHRGGRGRRFFSIPLSVAVQIGAWRYTLGSRYRHAPNH